MDRGERNRRRWLLAGGGVVVAVLALVVIAQLVLPGIAERRVRDELKTLGANSDVKVEAFPAVKLLFGQIDSVTAALGRSESSASEVADLLAMTDGIDELRISADAIKVSDLALGATTLTKDGDGLSARTSLRERDLRRFLPPGIRVRSISSRDGELALLGSFEAFGISLTGPARVSPEAGAIVLVPEGVPLAGLARVTIFSDPRVAVERLGAEQAQGRVELSAEGRLSGG